MLILGRDAGADLGVRAGLGTPGTQGNRQRPKRLSGLVHIAPVKSRFGLVPANVCVWGVGGNVRLAGEPGTAKG